MSADKALGWALVLVCAGGAFMLWRLGRDRYLPLVVFLAVWCAAISLFLLAGQSVFALDPKATLLIATGILAVLGGFAAQQLVTLGLRSGSVRFDLDRVRQWHFRLCIALVGFVSLQLFKVWPLIGEVGGIRGVVAGGAGLNFRRAYLSERLDELQGSLTGGNILLALLGYALFLGFASVFTGAYLAANGDAVRGLVPLVVIAVYAVFMLERAAFLYGTALYLAALFYFMRVRRPSPHWEGRQHRSWISLVTLGVLATIAIVQPILSRRTGAGAGEVQSGPLSYVYSGVSGLNGLVRLDPSLNGAFTGAFSPFPPKVLGDPSALGSGYGSWTFQGAAGIAARLGLISDSPPSSLNFVSTGPDLSGSTSNVYTFVIYLIYDYGVMGLVLGGVVLGLIVGICHRMVLVRLSVFFIPFASLGVATLAMSFFGLTLVRDFRYGVMCLFAALLLRALSKGVDSPVRVSNSKIRIVGSSAGTEESDS